MAPEVQDYSDTVWGMGWRGGSAVRRAHPSCRGTSFNSLHPHGSLQLSITPVLGEPAPHLATVGQTGMLYISIHISKTFIHVINLLKKRERERNKNNTDSTRSFTLLWSQAN